MEKLEAYFAAGGSLRELFGVDAQTLGKLYGYACRRYDAGDIEGARQIYFALLAVDPASFPYWLAAGLCYQHLQRHDEAIYCFSRSAQLRLVDPRSSYLIGVSFQLLGEATRARAAYISAIQWCGRHAEHRVLRAQAEKALEALKEGDLHG